METYSSFGVFVDYKKLYFTFINHFKNQILEDGTYTEKHHIILRYVGGEDSEDNLVRLTYRQHVFVHHLWAKATDDAVAWITFRLMAGIDTNARLQFAKLGGKKNKEMGWLDKIRPLANTPERQRKLKILHKQMKEDGRLALAQKMANDAWRGSNHTEEWKRWKRKVSKEYAKTPENREKLLKMQKIGIEKRYQDSAEYSNSIIENSERNDYWLYKKSNRSKNYFVSPEGLYFESPIYMAKYYGKEIPYYVVENWCKREQHGWKRIPKEVLSNDQD